MRLLQFNVIFFDAFKFLNRFQKSYSPPPPPPPLPPFTRSVAAAATSFNFFQTTSQINTTNAIGMAPIGIHQQQRKKK